ncbi:tandem-95 repeat protein [Rudanella paleaurantiibacter]|uniref:Tandem-95 repeat protein n=1 Tax=Rudanella paleaurantiibacter TaxID=2614655 RepID=A0A7J5U505_9BACT|nr:Ig-like domain-containing protein [Rudanella paleaurantiibacter]KAB7732922.1 tandem-95 repeat protein [Rudanella paleaurantiibacter]
MKRSFPSSSWVIGFVLGVLCLMSQLVQAQTPTIDLTTHEPTAALPAGVTLEWHNALPIGPGNLLSSVQTQSATPGVYYAVFNYGGTPVCYSQPSYLRVITNVCPATTVDLQTAVDAAATPAGSVVTYHSALTGAGTVDGTSQLTPAQVAAAPTSLSGTTYYVAYFDPVANCYSQPSPIVAVTTNCCLVTGITPVLSTTAITNSCPVTTINLSAITASNAPASTSLTWHSGTPATAANQLLSITAVSAGTYFAAFFDPINNCYSGTAVTPVTATTVSCAQPPIARGDIANTNVNTPVSGNVLTNDTDPQGGPLTASLLTQPAVGTVVLSPTGSFTYTPPTGFTGTVSFCYAASNTAGLSASACVSVNVNPQPSLLANDAPIANNDNTLTRSGVAVTVAVLANDSDPDSATSLAGQLANPTLLAQPLAGTAVVNANGTVTYTPPVGFTGVVSFPYQVCDGATPALCATALVTVLVQPTPPVGTTLAPVAVDDALVTSVNTPGVGSVSINDSDPQGLPLTYVSGQPGSGTVVLSPTGSYTYTPAVGFVGPDSFTYSVCNSAGLCDKATVSVLVQQPANQPPIVTPDVNTFIPGTPTAGNVLTNDRDPEGTPLTASVVGTPPAGFTLSPNGSYTYTSPLSQTAPVTVVINVCDSATPPACTTSTLTLVPVVPPTLANESPIALNDATRTTVGTPVTVAVLANDKDPEGQSLSNPTILSQPTVGTAVVNANGTVTYTPPANFTGVVTFPYQVCDTGTPVACATAVVTVAVDPTPPAGVTNIAPVAIDDQLLTTKNVSATGTVAANDSDPNAGQTLTFTKLTDPANGTVVFAANGSYTYTPPVGFVGTTNFTYQVCDNGVPVLCTTATVYITVSDPLVQAPIARGDIANTNVNTPVSGNVLTNDTDPQGGPLTASLLTQPAVGTVVLSPTGSFTYTPPTGFTGTVSFCYAASNTAGLSASACVSVNVNPQPSLLANDAPIANNDDTLTRSGVAVTVAVLANDSDPDSATSLAGQLANPTLLAQPSAGTAVVNANGTVTYTPPVGFTGVVSFPYQVCDRATPALCATALVTVLVQPTPPVGTTLAPVAVDDALVTSVNTPGVGSVSINDSDPQGLPLTYVSGQPGSGTVVLSPTGSYTYTPAVGFVGPDSFTYSVCNSAGLCDKATVSVLVQQPVNNALVLRLKVMLQGALVGGSGGLMRDDLRSRGFLPTTEPYTAIGGARFTHVNGGGGETMPASVTAQNVGTGNAVVDWVFVELRNPANMSVVVATRAALVQRDGDVVLASDGVSPLSFTGLSGTSFYVSVKHRNHLGAMTASAIPLSTTGTLVDFTTATGPQLYNTVIGAFNYEGWEQINVNGVQALWAGNANHDVKVKYQGSANDLITIFSEVIQAQTSIGITNPIYNYDNALGYYFGDVNMDGKVKYQGTSNDTSLIFTNVITNYRTDTMMNVDRLYNFDFMLEQIP